MKKPRLRATPTELWEIEEELVSRKEHDKADRDLVILPPPATNESIEGAVRWKICTMWQDTPVFLVVSCFCLTWGVLKGFYDVGAALLQ